MFRAINLSIFIQIISVLLTAIVLPVILTFSVLNLLRYQIEFKAYILKIESFLLPIITVGIIIMCFTSLVYFYEPYMLKRLIYSITSEVVYIIQIVMFSLILDVYFNANSIFIRINVSRLYWFFSIIPSLIIIKNIYNFRQNHKMFKIQGIILTAIKDIKGNIQSKKSIKKYIGKQKNVDKETKLVIFENLSNFLKKMEMSKKPIVKEINGSFRIAKRGHILLNYYNSRTKISKKFDMVPKLEDLEYWTEEDFS